MIERSSKANDDRVANFGKKWLEKNPQETPYAHNPLTELSGAERFMDLLEAEGLPIQAAMEHCLSLPPIDRTTGLDTPELRLNATQLENDSFSELTTELAGLTPIEMTNHPDYVQMLSRTFAHRFFDLLERFNAGPDQSLVDETKTDGERIPQ